MVAMGLCCETRCAYLWDPWHVLDVVAVATSWVSLMPIEAGSFSAIRSVRVLRPLRTAQRIKGMRILIGSLIASLSDLFAFLLVGF